MKLITHDQVKSKILKMRNQNVLLDSDVAELYGVESKRINEAVKRNLEKFPDGYVIELNFEEAESMRSQIATASKRNINNMPKAFTERGLYMLATILKSKQAINTTIAIIDTFTQFKELTQHACQLSQAKKNQDTIEVFEKSADIISDIFNNELVVSQQEDIIKIKLPFFEMTRKTTKIKNTS